jgi:hypothetical protein
VGAVQTVGMLWSVAEQGEGIHTALGRDSTETAQDLDCNVVQ